jgi:hypothetical protein
MQMLAHLIPSLILRKADLTSASRWPFGMLKRFRFENLSHEIAQVAPCHPQLFVSLIREMSLIETEKEKKIIYGRHLKTTNDRCRHAVNVAITFKPKPLNYLHFSV